MYRQHEERRRRVIATPRLELDVYRVPQGDTLMLPPKAGRVELEYYDSNDPYHCACFPVTSSKIIPTMFYDHIRCPHPERHIQPAQDEVFAYPWTAQTYGPPTASDLSRQLSALSGDSVLTVRSAPAYVGGIPDDKVSLMTMPHTAPDKGRTPELPNARSRPPKLQPLYHYDRYRLDTIREDQEVHPALGTYRTSNRHDKLTSSRYPNKTTFLPQTSGSSYPVIPKLDLRPTSEDYPSPPPTRPAPIDPTPIDPSPTGPAPTGLPLQARQPRGRDAFYRHWDFDRKEYKRKFPVVDSPRKAAVTPRPLPPPSSTYPGRDPGRMFVGEYVDPKSGRRYKYNVRYGRQHVKGSRHPLLTA